MAEILLKIPSLSTLFLSKNCYSYYSCSNYIVFYAVFLSINLNYFSLSTKRMLVMPKIYLLLLENSIKNAPDMPIDYHIETLRIAARLIGGKL